MANLTLADLLSFAKAGYTPKDVKELLTMEVPETKKSEDVKKDPEKDPDPEENKKGQETVEEHQQKDPTSNEDPGSDKIIDYKLKYEEAQETIKKLQEQNTKQDMSGEKVSDPLGSFDDLLRSMM